MRRCIPGGVLPAVFRWCRLHHRRRSAAAFPTSSAAPPLDPTRTHSRVSAARGEGPLASQWGEVTPGGKGHAGVRIGKGSDVIELHGGDTSSSTSCSSSSIPLVEEGGRRLHGLRWCGGALPAQTSRLVFLAILVPMLVCLDTPVFSSPSSSSSFMARSFGRWPCWSLTRFMYLIIELIRVRRNFTEPKCAEMRGPRIWIIDEDNRRSWNSPRLLLYFPFSTSTLGISCVRSLRWTHVASQYLASVSSRIPLSSSFGHEVWTDAG